MRKIFSLILSGAMAGTLILSASSCSEKIAYEATAFENPDVTYTSDANGETTEISDTLFGIFLEDINYASYALDDNLLVNNSFESTQGVSKEYGWSTSDAVLYVENTDGVLSDVEGYRDADVNTNYAKLVVNSANGALKNSGYSAVPIAVTKGTQYVFSAFVKSPDTAVNMTASVVDKKGNTYLSEEIQVAQDAGWIEYTRTIKATDTANSNLTFVLTFDKAATVYLDAITLETTDSTVGIKQYMYDAIKDLAPKFIRFPGGCIIEGNGYFNANGESGLDDTAYDWKNSIGAAVTADGDDIVPAFNYKVNTKNGSAATDSGATYGVPSTRKPNRDLWGGTNTSVYYDMEYGIGFYEYFMLCDSVGASAVPVLNVGYSCQGGGASNPRDLIGRHGNGVADYIQDALDLVAFAKGDVNSSDANEAYWAGIRKAMGHEQPFEMEYLGIGNEQWGAIYYSYYQQFLEAFREAATENPLYGEVQLIVGNGTSFNDVEKNGNGGTAKSAAKGYRATGNIENLSEYGVHDHHYYMNYTDFLANPSVYDSYSREDPDAYSVFVGEYSANDQVAQQQWGNAANYTFTQTNNSWLTALSEAAYMTGLERNGDIVKLAAYAPMFGSTLSTDNQWAADMMFYTNTQLVLTPNYYVQQLFMKNTGTVVLDTDENYSSDFEQTWSVSSTSGAVSVTMNKLFQIISLDEETGDVIVKIVNAYGEEADVNVELYLGTRKLTGVADVTVLQNEDLDAVSTTAASAVTPNNFKIGVEKTFGYTAQKYSVTVIRVHTK